LWCRWEEKDKEDKIKCGKVTDNVKGIDERNRIIEQKMDV